MSAYFVVELEITNSDAMEPYRVLAVSAAYAPELVLVKSPEIRAKFLLHAAKS